MPRLSVEAPGGVTIHCSTAQLDNVILKARTSDADTGANVLSRSSTAANELLSSLVGRFDIQGEAVVNLGTALRVADIRTALAIPQLRGVDLLTWNERIARAVDAHRHLTSKIIEEIVALNAQVLAGELVAVSVDRLPPMDTVKPTLTARDSALLSKISFLEEKLDQVLADIAILPQNTREPVDEDFGNFSDLRNDVVECLSNHVSATICVPGVVPNLHTDAIICVPGCADVG